MKVAVIPARGGSKRIPRKNVKAFCGKPMLAHPILAAQRSEVFDRIIVSTDDEDIAEVAQSYGAEAPFKRPAALSDDYTGTHSVIQHAVQWLQNNGCEPSHVCCIYATSPLIRPEDLRRGFELLRDGEWKQVFSAAKFPSTIFRSFEQLPDQTVRMFFPEHYYSRSQDLPEAMYDAGQFYWGLPEVWLASSTRWFSDESTVIELPHWRVQDIDTPEDWVRAELMYKVAHGVGQ